MEIAIISGKGGTGKSSISAAFAALSSVPVFAPYTVPAAAICAAIGVLLREGEEEK